MKILLLILAIGLYSCSTNKKTTKSYYYVEPFKDQEIKLFFNDDSTFSFQDLTGCNQFEFEGRYKRVRDSASDYFIFDSVESKKSLINLHANFIFPIDNGDTAWIINSARVFIHKQPFVAMSNKNINLQKIRYRKLEEYYTGLLGKEGFIKLFGDGKGRREAKKRLLECKLPDIHMK